MQLLKSTRTDAREAFVKIDGIAYPVSSDGTFEVMEVHYQPLLERGYVDPSHETPLVPKHAPVAEAAKPRAKSV